MYRAPLFSLPRSSLAIGIMGYTLCRVHHDYNINGKLDHGIFIQVVTSFLARLSLSVSFTETLFNTAKLPLPSLPQQHHQQ